MPDISLCQPPRIPPEQKPRLSSQARKAHLRIAINTDVVPTSAASSVLQIPGTDA
ncbi:hypothetical protein EWM64_g9209 [Hericium alpestre]|uniref:Uncharacterized protein n=1 Tax=Hericium alpestre TaxID=135208 RepID=A0A4Y9ZLH2_9AGAM|nr:hypothetical protein EWM64_g9209 [Hericium alpestre]